MLVEAKSGIWGQIKHGKRNLANLKNEITYWIENNLHNTSNKGLIVKLYKAK